MRIAALFVFWSLSLFAHATSLKDPTLAIMPGDGAIVPRDTRVMLFFATRFTPEDIHLQSAGVEIETSWSVFHSDQSSVLVMRPRELLQKNTAYEVRAIYNGAQVISHFTTSKRRDHQEPPALSVKGVIGNRFEFGRGGVSISFAVKLAKPRRQEALLASEIEVISDDKAISTPLHVRLFALWIVEEGTSFEPLSLPSLYLVGLSSVFVGRGAFGSYNLDIEHPRKIRLYLAPVDLSGNRGAPVEVLLDLTTKENRELLRRF